ncbi:MAPEG family protein [Pseudomonas wadenswilerensis]
MSGSLSVYALCVVVLFAKMLAVSCYQGWFRLRLKAFVNPEDAAVFRRPAQANEHPEVIRASRVWANDLENIPVFFVLGGLAVALGTSVAWCTALCVLFTLARVLHTLAYLARWQPWRTLFYGVGMACLLGFCAMVTVAALERCTATVSQQH